MKNWKLTSETKVNVHGVKLFRIELTNNCKWGNAGEKGGWIEKEDNLSGNAEVCGNARVYGNAEVYGNAWDSSPLQIQGSKHFVNVCANGFLQIGCKKFSLSYWKYNFDKIGVEYSYSQNQIKEYELYIDLAIELEKLK